VTAALPQRILIVEDNALVRQALALNLEDFGFAIVEADSVRTALARMAEHGPDIAAAVIDLGLPDGQGDALLGDLRMLHPGLPAVIATGSDSRDVARRLAGSGAVAVAEKPYQAEAIVGLLHGLIEHAT